MQVTVFLSIDLEGMPRLKLRGVLDKLEFENEQDVVVYDYKTGPRHTRGEIEGKPGDPKLWGDYKRELIFYKLLLSLYDYGRWNMVRGVIEFVDPDKRGRIAREEFDMTGEDPSRDEAALTALLRSVAEDIITLRFARRRCSNKECKYCKWRDLLER
jgi:DNA helicase-2/ATP-dependent DNA helicase PcrA